MAQEVVAAKPRLLERVSAAIRARRVSRRVLVLLSRAKASWELWAEETATGLDCDGTGAVYSKIIWTAERFDTKSPGVCRNTAERETIRLCQ